MRSGPVAGEVSIGDRSRQAMTCEPEQLSESQSGSASIDASPTSRRDRALVFRCLQGDEAAWSELVNTYDHLVLNHSYRFTGRRDIAEDLTQDIFLRAYRNLDSFRAESASFRTWLFRVTRNLLIDYHRKERRYTLTSFESSSETVGIEDDRSPGPLRAVERAEAAQLLSDGLMGLAPEMREAIILRELEGLSYREIAKMSGTVEGTIKSRVSRGRAQLAKVLSKKMLRDSRRRHFDDYSLVDLPLPIPEAVA